MFLTALVSNFGKVNIALFVFGSPFLSLSTPPRELPFGCHISPLKIASDSCVCVKREVCLLFQLVPLRGFGGLPNKWFATFPLIEVANHCWVCVKGVVSLFFLSLHSPSLRGQGGGSFWFSVTLPPSAYGLRPSASSSFFRLETLFLPFFALLYHNMNQPLTHPSYTNRPRFV